MSNGLRSASLGQTVAAVAESLEDRALLATITVTSLADDLTVDGMVTLREAIQAANTDLSVDGSTAGDGADTIEFEPSLVPNSDVHLRLNGTELAISSAVTIRGPELHRLTVNGEGNSRIFRIDDGTAETVDVSISGLDLFNGRSTGNSVTGRGGGILNLESLTLTDVSVHGNTARSDGGGISSFGVLTIRDSSITGNTTPFAGGGVYSTGTLVVTRTDIRSNQAGDDGGGIDSRSGSLDVSDSRVEDNSAVDNGGGISNYGIADIRSTSISGNTASSNGGGLFNAESGTATIAVGTISGNDAEQDGGGIYNDGSLTLQNTTISGNTASDEGGGFFNDGSADVNNSTISGNTSQANGGGGIYNDGTLSIINGTITGNNAGRYGAGIGIHSAATTTLKNTIVAGNAKSDNTPQDVSGILTSSSVNNLLAVGAAGQPTNGENGNIVDVDWKTVLENDGVSPILADNGGSTQTVALIAGSAAINAGSSAVLDAYDQRGAPFLRNDGGGVDIGAFEFVPPVLTVSIADSSLPENGGATTATVSRNIDTSAALTVSLTSSDTSEVTVSTSVTIAAGQTTSPAFTITGVDDAIVDGTQTVTVTATAAGYADGSATVDVTDDEPVTFVVTSAADNMTTDGLLTLREALQAANTDTSVDGSPTGNGADTITFSPGVFTTPQTITLSLGELVISDDVTLIGPGASLLTLRGSGARILNVDDSDQQSNATIVLQGMTLTNGNGIGGGAVRSTENLQILDSVVTGNTSRPDPLGSGRFSAGGGLLNSGTATILRSTFSNNAAASDGGAIRSSGVLNIIDSTIANNTSGRYGSGGVDSSGALTISNSTIFGNSSYAYGSGVRSSGSLTLTNSTIAGHSGHAGTSGLSVASGTAILKNSIIAGNSQPDRDNSSQRVPSDIHGTVDQTSANNLIGGSTTAGGLTDGTNGNIVGVDWTTVLRNDGTDALLQSNGGQTQTIALVTGSPAIDAGDNATAAGANLSLDQRGVGFSRIVDGDSDGTATVDIGAFESATPAILTVSISEENISEDGGTTLATVSRSGDTSAALTVSLTSSDTTEATVPVSVTIAAGQSESPTFMIAAVADLEIDETQTVTITAAATGLISGSGTVRVLDENQTTSPTVTGPEGNSAERRPSMTWQAVPGAVSYDVYLELIQTGANTSILNTTTTGTSLDLPQNVGDLGIGRYRAWVRATLPGGKTTWGTSDFQVSLRTTIADLEFHGQDRQPTIHWDPVPGAVSYRVYIRNDTARAVVFDVNVAGTGFSPSSDLQLGLHSIWVRAIGPQNYPSRWSEREAYYIGPSLLTPSGSSFNRQPQFSWTLVPGAESYRLLVRRGSQEVIDELSLTDTSFTPTDPLPLGEIRWWVLPRHVSGNTGQWSQTGTYVSGGQPTITSPIGTTNNGTPTITWDPIEGADTYEIYVYHEFGVGLQQQGLGLQQRVAGIRGTSFTTIPLPDGRYRIWVRAFQANGDSGSWSPGVFLFVEATFSATTTPASPVTPTFDTTPTFTWDSSGGSAYDLVITNGDSTIRQTVSTQSWTPSSPLAAGTWDWWVRAKNEAGDVGSWSPRQTTDTSGRAVLNPIGTTSDRTPLITWTPVLGAQRYDFLLDNLTTEQNSVFRGRRSDGGSGLVMPELAPGKYRAWVQAINGANGHRGPWSFSMEFTVTAVDEFEASPLIVLTDMRHRAEPADELPAEKVVAPPDVSERQGIWQNVSDEAPADQQGNVSGRKTRSDMEYIDMLMQDAKEFAAVINQPSAG